MMPLWIQAHKEGVEILGIIWLLKEHGPGKEASSPAIYIKSTEDIGKLKMAKKFLRTTTYDRDRGTRDKDKGSTQSKIL